MKYTLLKGYFSRQIVITILSSEARKTYFGPILAEYPHKCDVRHFSDVSVYSVKIRKGHFNQLVADLNAKGLTLVGYINTQNLFEIRAQS